MINKVMEKENRIDILVNNVFGYPKVKIKKKKKKNSQIKKLSTQKIKGNWASPVNHFFIFIFFFF